MNLLFIICARAGSKGAVGKNTRIFCGVPLVYYTLKIYEKYIVKHKGENEEIDLAVNTDSTELLRQIGDWGTAYIPVRRKIELAGDLVAKGDVIKDTVRAVEEIKGKSYDLVIDLDITSPLRELEDVEGTISQVLQNEECNFAYSVVESRRNPYFNMVCRNEKGFYDRVICSNYTARQQAPECFDMNASIYVYTKEYLMNMDPKKCVALVWKMRDSVVLDIDSDDDFEMMELLAEYYWRNGRYLDIR